MSSRLLLIIIGILVLLGLVIAVASKILKSQTPSAPTSSESVELPVVQAPVNNAVTFTTARGTVTTKDFYAAAVASSSFQVTLQNDLDTGTIYFDPKTRSFNIVANAPDIAVFRVLRPQLEQRLLALLGINQTDACKLNVFLNAYSPGVPQLDSVQFGLSFCPGALPTP